MEFSEKSVFCDLFYNSLCEFTKILTLPKAVLFAVYSSLSKSSLLFLHRSLGISMLHFFFYSKHIEYKIPHDTVHLEMSYS